MWAGEEASPSASVPRGRLVKAGDLVIIYEGHQSMKAAFVDVKKCHNCRFGAFMHKVRSLRQLSSLLCGFVSV